MGKITSTYHSCCENRIREWRWCLKEVWRVDFGTRQQPSLTKVLVICLTTSGGLLLYSKHFILQPNMIVPHSDVLFSPFLVGFWDKHQVPILWMLVKGKNWFHSCIYIQQIFEWQLCFRYNEGETGSPIALRIIFKCLASSLWPDPFCLAGVGLPLSPRTEVLTPDGPCVQAMLHPILYRWLLLICVSSLKNIFQTLPVFCYGTGFFIRTLHTICNYRIICLFASILHLQIANSMREEIICST